jgi:hypothetical protein
MAAGWSAGWGPADSGGAWSSWQQAVPEATAEAGLPRAAAAPGGGAASPPRLPGTAAPPWTPWWEQRERRAPAGSGAGAASPPRRNNPAPPLPWWELQEQQACLGHGINAPPPQQQQQQYQQYQQQQQQQQQQLEQVEQQAWWSPDQHQQAQVWDAAAAARGSPPPPPGFNAGAQPAPVEHALLSSDGSAGYGGCEFAEAILDRRTAPKDKRMMWNYLWGELPPRLMASIQMDEVASFSVTDMCTADAISRELLTLPGVSEVSTVTDATACVGGNAISLARFFRVVNAVELDPVRLQMLQHNLAVCLEGQRLASCADCGRLQGLCLCASPAGSAAVAAAADAADDDDDDDAAKAQELAALRGPPEPGVTGAAFESTGITMPLRPITGQLRPLQGDCLRVCAGMPQDIVFLDPPWGGKGYKQREKIELFLSHKPIHEVCAELGKHARYVALKLPLRADTAGLRAISGAAVVKEVPLGKKMLLLVLEFSRDLSGAELAFLMNIGLKGIQLG